MLTTKHLYFSYDTTPALKDVNIEVAEREFIALFGPNGGGKTTLLKLILGGLKPTRGTIELGTEEIGYVPQLLRTDRQFPISAIEVVKMGCLKELSIWGQYPQETEQKALDALDKVQLRHKASALFGTLSGGEAQRVLIARAIVNHPKLLLLDEPTASVDAEAERLIYELLLTLNKEMTILMVTHDLDTIVHKVHRLLLVHQTVSSLHAKDLCEHFAIGLYHSPLTTKNHFTR